jgi:hypothetical protein
MACAVRAVVQRQPRYLYRRIEGNILAEIAGDAMRHMLEAAEAPAMAGHVGRTLVADRVRGRAPQRAGVIVADIEGFAGTVRDGIIRPGRQLVFPAVDRPCVSAAIGSHLKAETRVGDHVDPRRRCRLTGPQNGNVLLAVIGKSAEPVEEFKIGHGGRGARRIIRHSGLRRKPWAP